MRSDDLKAQKAKLRPPTTTNTSTSKRLIKKSNLSNNYNDIITKDLNRPLNKESLLVFNKEDPNKIDAIQKDLKTEFGKLILKN